MQRKTGRVKIAVLIPLVLVILLPALIYGYSTTFAVNPAAPVTLDPKTIPKYVNQLVVPPVFVPDSVDAAGEKYTINMVQTSQQILPTGTPLVGNPSGLTNVWGYRGNAIVHGDTLLQLGVANGTTIPNFVHSPSATFEATRGVPINVTWINGITGAQPFAVDPTLNWANPTGLFPPGDVFSTVGTYPLFPPGFDGTVSVLNPDGLNAQSPVPLVPHLHGAEVLADFDGGPDAWWTSAGTTGPHYATSGTAVPADSAIYYYHNAQEANTLWYHDHALGITRINVMSGLAGYYVLRDPAATFDAYMTSTFQYGVAEIPIAIQDRTFFANGQIWYPELGINPTVHPYWFPEFFGDTIMVNGKVWPNLDVTPGWYRFRILDGSNARFYTLTLKDQITGLKIPFIKIGADGGYLKAPVAMTTLTIAPGERADILVDFSAIPVGTTIIVENKAKAPFPNGALPNPQTTGQIMQFTVKANGTAVTQGVAAAAVTIPASLNPTLTAAFPTVPAPATANRRFITLNEVMGGLGPLMAVINGQYYWGDATENATNGSTEDWYIINLTGDSHPIHTHLATFQLVSRQKFDVAKYSAAWLQLQIDPATGLAVIPPFPGSYIPIPLDPTPYMKGKIAAATPEEMSWKDTLQVHPGEVTVIRIRFTQQDGTAYPFDPTAGNGYVWHCHILEHEDNEMMRPLIIK